MAVLNDLGQTIIPDVFAALQAAGLVDTMSVYGEVTASDSGGGIRRTSAPVEAENDSLVYGSDMLVYNGDQITTGSGGFSYSSIPVTYKPNTNNFRGIAGGRSLSQNEFMLIFPTHSADGLRYDIDPKEHRLVLDSRGSEPAKTFRIISIAEIGGVNYKAICVKEN